MGKFVDLKGRKFGRLTIVRFSHRKNSNSYWLCKCECGNLKIVAVGNLKSGHTLSCGCLRKEKNTERFENKSLSLTHKEKLSQSHLGHEVSSETKDKVKLWKEKCPKIFQIIMEDIIQKNLNKK